MELSRELPRKLLFWEQSSFDSENSSLGISSESSFIRSSSIQNSSIQNFSIESSPGDVSLDALVDFCVESAWKDKLFSCMELLVFREEVLYHKVFGRYSESSEELRANSLFDLASMTKPIITATLTMLCVEKGLLSLGDPIALYYKEFQDGKKAQVTIQDLLSHHSGLPAHRELFWEASLESAKKKLLSLRLLYEPGTRVIYSCMGYLILGMILEKVLGQGLDELAQKYILSPLGMKNSLFRPSSELLDRIVPTGFCPLRKGKIHGEVHDTNNYFFEGRAGNSGLFSTAEDLFKYSRMILSRGFWQGEKILSSRSIDLMTKNQIRTKYRYRDPRGLGFVKRNDQGYPCGELFGMDSFGHLGFTGTSFWMERSSSVGIILLSNRVYYSYRESLKAMARFRIRLHNLILASLKNKEE